MKRKALRAFLHLPQESENMTTGSFEKGITRILAGKREDSQGTGIACRIAGTSGCSAGASINTFEGMKDGKRSEGGIVTGRSVTIVSGKVRAYEGSENDYALRGGFIAKAMGEGKAADARYAVPFPGTAHRFGAVASANSASEIVIAQSSPILAVSPLPCPEYANGGPEACL